RQVAPRKSYFKIVERRLCRGTVMKSLYNAKGQLLLGVHRMNCRQRFAEENVVVTSHKLVGDTHEFAEHFGWRLVYPDVVAKTFAHFLDSVQPFQNRLQTRNLLRLSLNFLQIPTDHYVEQLVCPSQLHIRPDHYRVPALHKRILEFVEENW